MKKHILITLPMVILGGVASYIYRKEIKKAMSLTKENLLKVIQIAKDSLQSKSDLSNQVNSLTQERDDLKTQNDSLQAESQLVNDNEVTSGIDEVITLAEGPKPVEGQKVDENGKAVFDEAGQPVMEDTGSQATGGTDGATNDSGATPGASGNNG